MKYAVVQASELGINCWAPCRFILENGRCDRVWTCSYPEKKRCQAIHAEISALRSEQLRLVKVSSNLDDRIEELAGMTKK